MPLSGGGIPAEVVDIALASPRVRRRAERFIEALFDDIEYTLQYGDRNERAQLHRAVVPALLKGVQNKQQDDEREQMRREYQELRGMLQGYGTKPPELPSAVVDGEVVEGDGG